MIAQPHSSAHLVLTAVQSMMMAEVIAQPAAVTITVRRDMFTLIAASLGEVLDTIAVLEESAAAGERIARELRIAQGDIARLEMQLTARDLERIGGSLPQPMAKSREERELIAAAKVIDLSEALRRELRGSRRPPSPDGGAA